MTVFWTQDEIKIFLEIRPSNQVWYQRDGGTWLLSSKNKRETINLLRSNTYESAVIKLTATSVV